MTTLISYQGKNLGKIRLNDNNTNKFVFIAEGLEALTQLFQIKPEDKVDVEGRGEITYEEFQRDTLPMIASYYPTLEHWFYKNERAKDSRKGR